MIEPTDAARVRLAEPADEDELTEMVREMHGELGFRNASDQPMTFSPGKVRRMIRSATAGDTGDQSPPSWLGVIEGDRQLEGSALLVLQSPWSSDDHYLAELWNFVLPKYRKSANAKTLIAFSKALSLTLQLPLLLGVMSIERQPAKGRLIERSTGCKPFGAFWLFNADAAGTV